VSIERPPNACYNSMTPGHGWSDTYSPQMGSTFDKPIKPIVSSILKAEEKSSLCREEEEEGKEEDSPSLMLRDPSLTDDWLVSLELSEVPSTAHGMVLPRRLSPKLDARSSSPRIPKEAWIESITPKLFQPPGRSSRLVRPGSAQRRAPKQTGVVGESVRQPPSGAKLRPRARSAPPTSPSTKGSSFSRDMMVTGSSFNRRKGNNSNNPSHPAKSQPRSAMPTKSPYDVSSVGGASLIEPQRSLSVVHASELFGGTLAPTPPNAGRLFRSKARKAGGPSPSKRQWR
jgi:hypothetical protein